MSDLVVVSNETLASTKDFFKIIRQACREVLVVGQDYGKIPGTDKSVLFKPGAEKLCQFLRLYPKYTDLGRTEDFNRPLFFYRYECQLVHTATGNIVGSGIGSCNSLEGKYRYRTASRVCPQCNTDAIITGKKEFGGGFICFKKKGGCGAKYSDGDPAITMQPLGKVENPDIFDQINTIDKMAQKRAFIQAVLIAAGVSELFTQDILDEPIEAEVVKETPKTPPSKEGPPLAQWDQIKSLIRVALKKYAAKNTMFDETEWFQEYMGSKKAQLEHIDRANTPEQMAKLEKALNQITKDLEE